ncbi:MAG: transposase [Candidatus Omnitrophota bacterium]|nr:transposase [Candidatus Omnitrophota bacterium]
MPRHARIVIPNVAHHITQRGNYSQGIFKVTADYKKYCIWMKEYSKKYKLDILAYCLMSNHVHFIVIPKREDSLKLVFNTAHMRYSQYMNRKKKAHGHLWQSRFFSCLLDDVHLYRAIRYVERNPVRAKMVKRAWEYQWSSAQEHAGMETSLIPISKSFDMNYEEWKRYMCDKDPEIEKEIWLKTQRGLAVGEKQFIKRIERKIERSLECLNPGRPWGRKK